MSSSARAETRAARPPARLTARAGAALRWLAAGTLLAVCARAVDWPLVATALAGVRLPWLAAGLVAYAAILPLWAVQWNVLLTHGERPGARRMFDVVALTSAAMNTAPLLIGGASAAVLLTRLTNVRRAAALSLLAVDQLLVGIAKVALLVTLAALAPLPVWAARGLLGLAAAVAALYVALLTAGGRGARHAAKRLVRRAAPSRVTTRRTAALLLRAARGARALGAVRSPTRLGGGLALALLKIVAEVLALVAVQRAVGVALAPSAALLVLAAINFATMVPVAPANLGVYEAAAFAVYRHLGLAPGPALALAALHHAVDLVALVGPGYVVLLLRRRLTGAAPDHASAR